MFIGRGELALMNIKLFIPKEKDHDYQSILKKTKKIGKCRQTICRDDCKRHQFSMRRLAQSDRRPFYRGQFDITVSFCPREFLGTTEGGHPLFNNDGRSDTPCFLTQYQKMTEKDCLRLKGILEKGRIAQESMQINNCYSKQVQNKNKQPNNTVYTVDRVEDAFISELQQILSNKSKTSASQNSS